jgi:probable DNA repair protein
MLAPRVAGALAAGATIVTPNRRLARHLTLAYDEGERARGMAAWPAARILPWSAWLDSLWQHAIATTALPAPLAPAASRYLWQSIVRQSTTPLLDAVGAADDAARAYALFLAWRDPREIWPPWPQRSVSPDVASFTRWTQRYRAALSQQDAIDAADLADLLTQNARAIASEADALLYGFLRWTPQQRRLVSALQAAGAAIEESQPPQHAETRRSRVECASPSLEIEAALRFARARVGKGSARVAIVVPALAARRTEIAALAEEILCPQLLDPLVPEAPRPYGISLGAPLSAVTMIATALDLMALGAGAIDATAASALVRSPYLPDADATWHRRARCERTWRDQGRRKLGWNGIVGTLGEHDPALAKRWRGHPPPRERGDARAWVRAWSDWLARIGWPGERASSSSEWQAREAFSRLLDAFAKISPVAQSMSAAEAHAALRDLADASPFQPEGGVPPVQILGVREAAGIPFDAIWLAGFDASAWPPPVEPNPFLPLAWQRDHEVPAASAARTLTFSEAITAALCAATPEIIASHARVDGEAGLAPSPLTVDWPLVPDPAPDALSRRADALAAQRAFALREWRDDAARQLPAGSDARGGTGVIESQSACPFQAFARYRLRTEAWPPPGEGLTPLERGNLLHDALCAFWTDVRDSTRLSVLDDAALDSRIAAAATAARAQLAPARWRSLPPAVAACETNCLARSMRSWLDDFERPRPPFTVTATEKTTTLALGGINLRVRIDRVDHLDGGGIAIVDYKSGQAPSLGSWFAPRPSGTQIGIYALAERAYTPTQSVRAAAYAKLKAGEQDAIGIAADNEAWPKLRTIEPRANASASTRIPFETWSQIENEWRRVLTALAEEFRGGVARVDPRVQACNRCDLQSLCRIQALAVTPTPIAQLDDVD